MSVDMEDDDDDDDPLMKELDAMAEARLNRVASEGSVFVCPMCGKTSARQWGPEPGECSMEWDESCSMRSHLVAIADIEEPAGWKPYERVRRVR